MGARRERYARAIESAGGVAYPMDFYLEADAVMAVADEEHRADLQMATDYDRMWQAEVKRLRAKLEAVSRWTETTEHGEAAADVLSILEGVG